MPPQLNPAGCGPVHNQATTGAEEVKQCEPEKKQAEPQKDSSAANASTHRATPKEAANRKAELAMTGRMRAISLKNEKTAETLKGTVPDIAKKAVELTNAGARGIGKATAAIATANVVNQARIANQAVQGGLAKAREINLLAEIKSVGPGTTFENKEQLIKKIDAFRQGASWEQLQPLYQQETFIKGVSSGGLTELLQPYGYYITNESRLNPGDHEPLKATQTEILDTALHNWRVSRPDIRVALSKSNQPPPTDFDKGWNTPQDTRFEDRQKEARQVTLQKEPYDNQAYPVARPRETQTNPDKAYMEYKKGNLDSMYGIINSLAGAEFGGSASESPGESMGSTRAPYRGTPPEPISAAETQLGQSKSTSARGAESQTAVQTSKQEATKVESDGVRSSEQHSAKKAQQSEEPASEVKDSSYPAKAADDKANRPDLMLTNNHPRTPQEAQAIDRWRAQQQRIDDILNRGAGEADVLGDQLEIAEIGNFERDRGDITQQVREALKNNLEVLPENIQNELDRLDNELGENIRNEVKRLRELEAEKIRVQKRTSRQLRDQ